MNVEKLTEINRYRVVAKDLFIGRVEGFDREREELMRALDSATRPEYPVILGENGPEVANAPSWAEWLDVKRGIIIDSRACCTVAEAVPPLK